MAKKAAKRRPKPAKKAELIVRQGFVIDATGKTQQVVPEVLILGNREGFQYLSDVFADLAERAKSRKKSPEAEDTMQMGRAEHPVNVRLSDDLEFRFAPLTAANRTAAFKQYGITMKSRQKGSLFERYQEVATQFSRLGAIAEKQSK